ncbi:four-carbon acid sugar kinase family protein [Phyllobacterium sp. SB3]|uniref:four-carbon acid sugar kinase family protein n=1 Tax=Phyllobacterium sp. SB3 TaxID=3156073 RepID=UPI0032AEC7EA
MSAIEPTAITELRLLADDVTGALDTAAQFTAALGPIPVHWGSDMRIVSGSMGLDSATREGSTADAAAKIATLATVLIAGPDILAFKKLDSLLRGHDAVEINMCLQVIKPTYCIVAPAFPFQHRVTRGGRQYTLENADWRLIPSDLARDLTKLGHQVTICRPADAVPNGISIWDASTDSDLAAIAAKGRALGDVLWCGSSGLAGALVDLRAPNEPVQPLRCPIFGLFGSNHPSTVAQLEQCGPLHMRLDDGSINSAKRIARGLKMDGTVFASFNLPAGLARAEAAARINSEMARLVQHIDPPGALIVAGGETLRALCISLGAVRLDVQGQIMQGVPRSIMRGGRFDGVEVLSKSGAFGAPSFLQHLVGAWPLQSKEC